MPPKSPSSFVISPAWLMLSCKYRRGKIPLLLPTIQTALQKGKGFTGVTSLLITAVLFSHLINNPSSFFTTGDTLNTVHTVGRKGCFIAADVTVFRN